MYYIGRSKIEGEGLFADSVIEAGTVILKLADPYPDITPSGRKINHSTSANGRIEFTTPKLHILKALRTIQPDEEITVDYNVLAPYYKGPDPLWRN